MDLGLKDKTVIVTGGAKGIGSGISEVYAQEGANLVINYHSDQAGAEAFAVSLAEKYGVRIVCVQGDVSSEIEVKRVFDAAESAFGAVDILVNNAGRGYTADFREITLEDWNRCLNDNLTGQFLMSREFARRAIPAERKGWIVNILSKASVSSTTKGRVCYVANKAGELGLTHAMAVDLTTHGIRVNGVMPGFVLGSNLIRQRDQEPEVFSKRIERVPLKRVGEAWEIGTMVAFLTSDKSELAVGTCVDMTGGLLLGF